MMKNNSIYLDNSTFEKLKDKALLLDVRTAIEFNSLKTLPNSKNVYLYDLIANPANFIDDKDDLIITLCNGGNRSSDAAHELRQHGYHNAFVLEHGIYGYYRWLDKAK
ncbi:hypothetical protein SSYRP_v1c08670 [Spiroplasma syrphidicola EA-1]|uniref:Rhodanese domain-containing protein n=1 Tax=Spiroplasma syrphidicola EA-1 TaxID=1276229 RepID=R4UMJ0_9MOLU|nr:rhodanese-like domain-containing protein [Spiroplasma syrphidicola]AGM26456.1 hypothetical protein SSYRP_v1c08670 [Spiroplasma syrphidicola EA-1]